MSHLARLFASLVLLVAVVASVAVAEFSASAAPEAKLCIFPRGYTVFDFFSTRCVTVNDHPTIGPNLSTLERPNSTADPCYGSWTAANKANLANCFANMNVMSCNIACADGSSDFFILATRKFAQTQCNALKTACDVAFNSTSCSLNSHSASYSLATLTSSDMCADSAFPAGFPAITAVSWTELDKFFSGMTASDNPPTTSTTGSASTPSVVTSVVLVIVAFMTFF